MSYMNTSESVMMERSANAFNHLREEEDHVYNDILHYHQTMIENIDCLNELIDGCVVLAVGATGVGKSTLMNAIIQGSD